MRYDPIPNALPEDPRPPDLADMTDDEFLAYYRDLASAGVGVEDKVDADLLHRYPALRIVFHRLLLSHRADRDRTGGHPDPIHLKMAPESETTRSLADAYRALWQWIILGEDAALRARPTMSLSQILQASGITRSTWDAYVSRRHVPPRIGYDWHTGEQVWDQAVIDQWLSNRPARLGTRT
jgi:predicted DNA-binding transcriptional regulator AlpA